MKTFVLVVVVMLALAGPSAAASIQAVLTWTDVPTETGYRVERRAEPAGTYAVIGTVNANVVTVTDTTVQQGSGYCWRVIAFNQLGDGVPSDEGCGSTPAAPGKVSNVTITIIVVP